MQTKKIALLTLVTSILLVSGAQARESIELSSPEFVDGGMLPVKFTCEGEGISPPLSWRGVPQGTQSLVIIMDHMPMSKSEPKVAKYPAGSPDSQAGHDENNPAQVTPAPLPSHKPNKPEGLRWYWGMYNVPATVSGIQAGQVAGALGSNVVNRKSEYAPPCSKGPGVKNYSFHLYALSAFLALPESDNVSAAVLRNKMRGLVLGSGSLTVSFERYGQTQQPVH
ncbi:YbhB/YbcL family Raf kinase inhibitor-like protein [Amphritea sp.]|uniref:YbhB/YbcL family Raf kinase inhibitor-like protein n=1 Tax=Amphritea sp. TaxID=1872502 RepID=UPI003A8FEC43